MTVRSACQASRSVPFKKTGHIHRGKQNHQCKACGRQFVASAEERIIVAEQRTLIQHLLCERISLRGICIVQLTWCFYGWKLKPMSCGALYRRKPIGNGFGARWTPKLAKSLPFTSGIAVATVPMSCGPRSRWCTVSRPRSIRTNRSL